MRTCLCLGLLVLVGCREKSGAEPEDNDYDGFFSNEDCDDDNPWIHPGATETPGDGIDGDCDGEDGVHDFVGTWELTYLSAGFSGFEILVPDAEYGELTVGKDLQAELFMHAEVDPAIAPLTLDLELSGEAVPDPLPGSFSMVATGVWGTEDVYVGWACESVDAELACIGELKMLGYGFENVADFEAAE